MRSHYNKIIQTEIKQLERFKEQAEKRSSIENMKRFEDKIIELQNELTEDTPRYLDFVKEQTDYITLQQKNQHDKKNKTDMDVDNQTKLDDFYKKESQLRKEDRHLQYQMRKEWDWLCKQDIKLPDYIRTNLSKMPNNKGYIWKGIWYFGHKPNENNNNLLIMFERPLGSNDMLIHEIKRNEYYRILKKDHTGRNVIISEKLF